jgi:peptide/nickel transport system substrate-binding protein
VKRARVGVVLSFAAVALGALSVAKTRAADEPAWRKLRPDAPAEPEAKEYEYAFPKLPEGWTPPSREELTKLLQGATDGPIRDAMEIGTKRAKANPPQCTVAEALALKNDSDETNAKIVSALSQPPASDDEVDWDATFNRHSMSPNSLNPLFGSSAYEAYMNTLHNAGLFTFDHTMVSFADPEFVKTWKRTKDIDYVVMQDDLTWEDGEPITAEDIEFSFHVIMDPSVPIPAQRTGPDQIKWVKAYDKTTIVFFHKEPLVTNINNMNFAVIPKHIYQRSVTADPTLKTSDWHAYWNRHPLSGNSYRLKEWRTGDSVVFERREDWAKPGKRRRPYFKQMRFKIIDDPNAALLALKKGDIDEMLLRPEQWSRQSSGDDFYNLNTKVRGPEWTYFYVGWNERIKDKPLFVDPRVRHALALAFNHEDVLKKEYFGLFPPCAGPFHPDSPWGDAGLKPMKQDVDQAETLLDEAGWKRGADGIREKDGVKFVFTMLIPTGATTEKAVQVLRENLKDVGITMTLKPLEWATYLTATQDHAFEACTAGMGVGTDPDSSKNLWKTEMREKGRNVCGYANKRVDELYDLGQREFDHEKRRKIYQEIDKLIYDDQPLLFLFYRASFWAFSKEMRGYNFSPRGPFSYGPGSAAMWKPKKKS